MKGKLLLIAGLIIAGIALYWPIRLFIDSIGSATSQAKAAEPAVTQEQETPGNVSSGYNNDFLPGEYTPKTYLQPKYDPFNNKFAASAPYTETVDYAQKESDSKPAAYFTAASTRKGFADKYSGTAGTEFKFDANGSSDNETAGSKLQVRWDFESDGQFDTYFSQTKTARHTYDEAGDYDVTLEVMDTAGNVKQTVKRIKIVNDTEPFAYFSYNPISATTNTVFEFDTGKSSDSQYRSEYLEYRFDWDSDGVWDTPYNTKTLWRHVFDKPGTYTVTMEVKDPGGLTKQADAAVEAFENTPPVAKFEVSTKNTGSTVANEKKVYSFDASASTDAETPANKLLYRWDFNYTGKDDIAFDTSFSTSNKHYGTFTIPGEKVIRLQVKDLDGAVTDAFTTITVE